MAANPNQLNQFARDVITGLGGTPTPSALKLFLAQQRKEGGWTNNAAAFNPLNRTDQGFPTMNSVGVAVYPNYKTGVARTVDLLRTGYPSLANAYKTGNVSFQEPGLQGDFNRWLTGKRTPGMSEYVRQIASFYGAKLPASGSTQTQPAAGGTAAAAAVYSPFQQSPQVPSAAPAIQSWLSSSRQGDKGSLLPLFGAIMALRQRNAAARSPMAVPSGNVPAPSSQSPSGAGAGAAGYSGGYPTGWVPGFKGLGMPGQGTHTLGNWQSDNAFDLGAKPGTPVYAPSGGVVREIKPGEMSGRFGGYAVYLDTPDGPVFLKHLGDNIPVKPGQRLEPGALVGYIGDVKGLAPHLHLGYKKLPSNRR